MESMAFALSDPSTSGRMELSPLCLLHTRVGRGVGQLVLAGAGGVYGRARVLSLRCGGAVAHVSFAARSLGAVFFPYGGALLATSCLQPVRNFSARCSFFSIF